jgi:glycosyltransferase involved in cell wall biosynthesis
MNEKVSILMTVFNCEDFLKYSIKSILDQTYKNFELIIVNDCSTDGTSNIIKSFRDERIRSFNLQKRLGRTKALNFGLDKCISNLIAIQDADDISYKNRLNKTINKILENDQIGLIFSNFDVINSKGILEKKFKLNNKIENENIFFSKLKYINLIAHSTVIFRRNLKFDTFRYNENFIYAQDYHMILWYLKNSRIYKLNENLAQIRYHSNNMTNQKKLKKTRILESLSLLNYSKNKFKNNIKEKFFINFFITKNFIKLFFYKFTI